MEDNKEKPRGRERHEGIKAPKRHASDSILPRVGKNPRVPAVKIAIPSPLEGLLPKP